MFVILLDIESNFLNFMAIQNVHNIISYWGIK